MDWWFILGGAVISGIINYLILFNKVSSSKAVLMVFAEVILSIILAIPCLYIIMFVFIILNLSPALFGYSGDEGWTLFINAGYVSSLLLVLSGNAFYSGLIGKTDKTRKIILYLLYITLAVILIVLAICLLNVLFDFL